MHRSASTRAPRVRFEVVPKRSGLRVLSHLDPGLADAYTVAVARVAAPIERTLGPEVLAHRVAVASERPPVVVLRSWRHARVSFAILTRPWPPGLLVLRTDVAECYATITSATVVEALHGAGAPAASGAACGRVLDELVGEGVSGLPIGPPPSAVLANAVLSTGDDALRRAGVPFVRWVDDWWIAVHSGAHAAQVLGALGCALERAGLRLNDAKTRIGGLDEPSWTASAAEYHRAADAHPVPVVHGSHPGVPADRRLGVGGRQARPTHRER